MSGRSEKAAIRVAQRIVADVASRGIRVGDRLPPEHIMLAEYGVARGTLRESLRFLELQGVIELRRGPHGGPIVRKPDAASLEIALTLLLQFQDAPFSTIAEARAALEPMMAQLAAHRMDEEQLAELRLSLDTMAAGLDDRATFLEMNKRFHDLIAHGSGNSMFGFLIDALLGILDGSAMGIDYPERQRIAVLDAHTRIFDAISSHDAGASASAMSAHIEEYSIYARRKFPAVLEKPIRWDRRD
jgi:DNA-binding FadR family transcriptional regulator